MLIRDSTSFFKIKRYIYLFNASHYLNQCWPIFTNTEYVNWISIICPVGTFIPVGTTIQDLRVGEPVFELCQILLHPNLSLPVEGPFTPPPPGGVLPMWWVIHMCRGFDPLFSLWQDRARSFWGIFSHPPTPKRSFGVLKLPILTEFDLLGPKFHFSLDLFGSNFQRPAAHPHHFSDRVPPPGTPLRATILGHPSQKTAPGGWSEYVEPFFLPKLSIFKWRSVVTLLQTCLLKL